MATLTIRLPDDKHNRLKALARRKKISVNKRIEEISTQTLAEFDSETRFRTLAASGDVLVFFTVPNSQNINSAVGN